ncbi:hypothetical protein LCGC14_0903710 [marine sediment metagenome]|uniref:Uncharacterized protein n=1 Tax=marine sediment metagenome TaxID=412755 RepID=A0A0F9REP1_9ZZZZ
MKNPDAKKGTKQFVINNIEVTSSYVDSPEGMQHIYRCFHPDGTVKEFSSPDEKHCRLVAQEYCESNRKYLQRQMTKWDGTQAVYMCLTSHECEYLLTIIPNSSEHKILRRKIKNNHVKTIKKGKDYAARI